MPITVSRPLQVATRELFGLLYEEEIPESLTHIFENASKKTLSSNNMISLHCAIEKLKQENSEPWKEWFRGMLEEVETLNAFEEVILEFGKHAEGRKWRENLESSDPFKGNVPLRTRKAVSATLPSLSQMRPGKVLLPPSSWKKCTASPVIKDTNRMIRMKPGVTLLEEDPDNPGTCCFPLKMGPRKGQACLQTVVEGQARCRYHMKSILAGEEGHLRSARFRVHGTIHMQRLLPKWFGACRVLYNRCVIADSERDKSCQDLRSELITQAELEPWMKSCPYNFRKEVVKDYCGGREAANTLYHKKLEKHLEKLQRWRNHRTGKRPQRPKEPEMKYRTKKDVRSVIHIPKEDVEVVEDGFKLRYQVIKKECLNRRGRKQRKQSNILYVNMKTKRKDKRFRKLFEDTLKHDIRLIRYRDGRLYIEVPVDITPKNIPTPKVAVGIDPGLRTPFVAAGTDGTIFEMGSKFRQNVDKYRERKGNLQSKLAKLQGKKNRARKKRLRKQIGRLDSKITNTRTQFHYEAIKELSPYQHVYLPKTNYNSWNRGLNRTCRRRCQEVAHPLFRNRLINKSEIMGSGRTVQDCNEYMTTKTCSSCFRIHDEIGSNEVFACPSCKVVVGRDHNAARNILLINLRI